MKKRAFVSNGAAPRPEHRHKIFYYLTWTHPYIPISLYFMFSIGLIWWTYTVVGLLLWEVVALFLGGLVAFTFVEYMTHRWVFHMFEVDDHTKDWTPHRQHGIHHDYPKDINRLAMPPIASIVVASVFFYLFRYVLDDYSYSFTAGFLSGYALYLVVHYVIHVFRAPNNAFKALWVNHSIHHYQDEEIYFGVTSPMWDHIFGTVSKADQKHPESGPSERRYDSVSV